MVYDYRLRDNIKKHIHAGHIDDIFPEDEQPAANLRSLNQKNAIMNKKKELEKQIFNLRMKHNAMLNSEFNAKMKKL